MTNVSIARVDRLRCLWRLPSLPPVFCLAITMLLALIVAAEPACAARLALVVLPKRFNFGPRVLGLSTLPKRLKIVTLRNPKKKNSQTLTIKFQIVPDSDFQPVNSPSPCVSGGTLSPGDHCTIGISFSPTDIGLRTAQLQVSDNVDTDTQLVNLRGRGVPAKLRFKPASLNFGRVKTGGTKSLPLMLINRNKVPILVKQLQITHSGLDAKFDFTGSCVTTIPPRSKTNPGCPLSVTFEPTAVKNLKGTRVPGKLTITEQAGASLVTQNVNLSGIALFGPPPPGPAVSGTVMGGAQPLVGTTVNLFAMGSISGTVLPVGAPALTDPTGHFSIPYPPPPVTPATDELYLVASGPSSSPQTVLMAVLGQVSKLPANPIMINEVTTIGSVWAMAQFMSPVRAENIGGPSLGIDIAAATVANLVDVTTGQPHPGGPEMTTPAAALNSLADILATCVGSSGRDSAECAALFTNATPPGSISTPSDTLTAARNIALNPANNVSALFSLMPSGPPSSLPFNLGNVLSSAPNDWTLNITYAPPSLASLLTGVVTIDGLGNVWVGNPQGADVVELNPTSPLTNPTVITDPAIQQPVSIAVGMIGSPPPIWVADTGSNSLVELSGTNGSMVNSFTGGGLSVSGTFLNALALDAGGNLWVADDGPAVSEFGPDGKPMPSSPFPAPGSTSIAVDANGNVWTAGVDSGDMSGLPGNALNELDPSGTVINPFRNVGGLCRPFVMAIDRSGFIWVGNSGFVSGVGPGTDCNTPPSLSKFCSSVQGASCKPGTPLPGSPFTGGGLPASNPCAIAFDGATPGDVWVASGVAGLAEFTAAGTPVSPTGFMGADPSSNPGGCGVGIDPAGNVWSAVGGRAVELVGAAPPPK
jgi:Cep192 domain 4